MISEELLKRWEGNIKDELEGVRRHSWILVLPDFIKELRVQREQLRAAEARMKKLEAVAEASKAYLEYSDGYFEGRYLPDGQVKWFALHESLAHLDAKGE